MAHALKDCIDLLKKAWGEVSFKEINSVVLQHDLSKLLSEIESDTNNGRVNLDSFRVLGAILTTKIRKKENKFPVSFTCKNLYESLVMLLNSGYEKYDFIDIGNAREYLNEALPLYKKLCGDNFSITLINKERSSRRLGSDNILSKLEKDVDGLHVLISQNNFRKALESNGVYSVLPIATKGYYEVQLVINHTGLRGMKINDTYSVRVLNNKTGKELRTPNYSDIKRILNRA